MQTFRRSTLSALAACALLGAAAAVKHVAIAVAQPLVVVFGMFLNWVLEPKGSHAKANYPLERAAMALLQAKQYAARLIKRQDIWPNSYGYCPT